MDGTRFRNYIARHSLDERRKEFQVLYDHYHAVPGLDRTDRALERIWNYGKKITGSRDSDTILREIKSLGYKMGSPDNGEKPWSKLITYVDGKDHQQQDQNGRTD